MRSRQTNDRPSQTSNRRSTYSAPFSGLIYPRLGFLKPQSMGCNTGVGAAHPPPQAASAAVQIRTIVRDDHRQPTGGHTPPPGGVEPKKSRWP